MVETSNFKVEGTAPIRIVSLSVKQLLTEIQLLGSYLKKGLTLHPLTSRTFEASQRY